MLFHYKIEFHPDVPELYDNLHHGIVTEQGICDGNTYGEAANKIVEYVGTENVIQLTIYELENPLCEDEIRDMF